MSSTTVALFAFVCIFGGALLGLLLRAFLPEHHLSDDARDVVKLGIGLIATLAALVLGLLVSTAKNSLDVMQSELVQSGAKIIMLDRTLANYGPETKDIRDRLRFSLAAAITLVWPEDKTRPAQTDNAWVASQLEKMPGKLRELSPRNDSQRALQAQALQGIADLAQSRWLLIEQIQNPLPKAFLYVLLFWLTTLFIGFGILAPRNATVIAVLLICAVSVSGAIFIILEMNTPLTGMIKVSNAPLRKALDHLGK